MSSAKFRLSRFGRQSQPRLSYFDLIFLSCFLVIILSVQSANASDSNPVGKISCINSAVTNSIPNTATPRLYDTYPYKFLSKSWAASNSMVAHFNAQNASLSDLQGQSNVTHPVSKIRLATAGDIMRMPSEQKHYVDKRLNQHLEKFDVVLANLETLVSPHHPVPPENLFLMNSDPSVLSAFKRSDGSNIFSALSFANNHTFDFPDQAIEDTLNYLDGLGVPQSGIQRSEKSYVVIEKNGIRIGYYAITTFLNIRKAYEASNMPFNSILEGIALKPYEKWNSTCDLDYQESQKALAQMDEDNIDFKIFSIHWGFEHHMYPQPQQLEVAREIMRQGWDVVIGAHSHTMQPAEVCYFNGYEKSIAQANASPSEYQCVMNTNDGIPRKAIAYYSLGNLTSYTPIFWQQVGAIAELDIEKDAKGKTDWHSPKYTYTYDHTSNPPNGKQFLTLFDREGIKCPWDKCVNELDQFLDLPKQHMEGKGFTLIEQGRNFWNASLDAMSAFWKWGAH